MKIGSMQLGLGLAASNATEVLAKHDENYMPPEAQHAVDQARKGDAK